MPSLSDLLPLSSTTALTIAWALPVCLAMATSCVASDPQTDDRRFQYIELSDQSRWTLERQGNYHARYDRRDLYCMYHLWTTAAEGDHATLTTTVTIPADWKPPYGLELYCSDDYIVDPSTFSNTGWMSCHAYPGHRFKQVLVDGEVVWDVDVGDIGREEMVGIELTGRVRPGEPFTLALRMVDKVGTDVHLAGEFFAPGGFDPKEDPRAFVTHLYWGDILLTERFDMSRLRPWRERPSTRTLRERIAQGLVPRGPLVEATQPVSLALEAPRGVAAGWPLSCGVPLPAGAVTDAQRIRLRDARGRDLSPQADVLSLWQDGSIRSALLTTPIPADAEAGEIWTLTWGAERAGPGGPVCVRHAAGALILSNGAISVRVPAPTGRIAISGIADANGETIAGPLEAYLIDEREGEPVRYEARWCGVRTLSAGPRLASVELQGKLTGPGRELGRCVLRLSLVDGSPLLQASFRIFNDTPDQLRITDLALSQRVRPGKTRGVESSLGQPDGWFGVDGGGVTTFAAVRWAAEMPTKKLELEGDRLFIHLFSACDETPYFRPRSGEARRHELTLGYYTDKPSDPQLSAVAACVQRPPRLWDALYACQTGALGYGYVHNETEFAALTGNRAKAYGDLSRERCGQAEYDIRNFGDRRYGDKAWCNNYYDASRGFLAEYMMTGTANAFDRAAEEVLHQIDVDTCHWHENPTFLGGLWSYAGDDHSNAGYVWAALLRCMGGWVYYYRLTGDPDARDAARELAEYVLRDGHNMGFQSVRDHGGTLTALVWAYDEFGDPRYLQGALETMRDIHTRMVRRRGPYVEPNGNYSWWVSIPWMAAEMADAHYRLWQLSGDEEAAVTALGLIESLMQENGTWGLPGETGGYSGNPYLGGITSNYDIILAPVFAYGYEMTADPEFLLWARKCFERTLAEGTVDAITNNYWLTPALLCLLHRYRNIETPMPAAPAELVRPNKPREK